MRLSILSRRLHRWGALIVMLPIALVISAGLLLQVKKQVPWVQPPELRTDAREPLVDWATVLRSAQAVPEAGVRSWADVERVDLRPAKGMLKLVTNAHWELQMNIASGEVLQSTYRRSDLIESLHDGSFFGDRVKLFVFLPVGTVLLGLWLTGVYLWLLPILTRQKRARLAALVVISFAAVGTAGAQGRARPATPYVPTTVWEHRSPAAMGVDSALLAAAIAFAVEQEWTVLIRNGTIVDGTGTPGYRGDVAMQGDRIVAVSRTPLDAARAARVVDATGLIVAPGFIDLHAHLEPLLRMPDAKSHVTQGVTLALGGPDGSGPLPLGAYLDSAQRSGLGMNVAYLVGHNSVRRAVMGTANRTPTADELARMVTLIRQAMGDGAFGISTGLRYVPGFYSKTDEVVALSRAAADSGGFYTSHLREEGLGLFQGVGEAITIAREAGIPVVLTHHKAIGQPMWGKSVETLRMVDSARASGLDVMIDQYPYTATSTGLSVLIPPWALAGGASAFRARIADAGLRDSILRGVVEFLRTDRGGGDTRRVQFSRVSWDESLEGRSLADWAERRGVGQTLEAAAQLVIEGELNGGASMIYHVLDEGDVRRIMQHPQTMIASDGRLNALGEGVPHPRAYGTFPRVLGHYVREERVLTLEQAVHKMTGMPAARMGLQGQRGCVAVGCFADVTVFDAARVGSAATFAEPHRYAVGINYVFVNGATVVDGGEFTQARLGRALRRRTR